MITLKQYLMGRDQDFTLDEVYRKNAVDLIEKVNRLLNMMMEDKVYIEVSPKTASFVSSGWRPIGINANTPNAATRSKHITCQACDLYDPEGDSDEWCMNNLNKLEEIGLWMEHPSATKGWSHLQSVPPRSGRRVFYP